MCPRAMVTRRDGDNYQTVCCFNPRDFPLSTFSDAMASWLVKIQNGVTPHQRVVTRTGTVRLTWYT